MEIGERLRESRLQKNLSLDHIQEITKIQKRYLVAIEEGEFDILPGKFYARAFIKEYANAVGLNPDELLEDFKEEVPQAEEMDTTQYTRIERSRKENSTSKTPAFFSFFPTIIVVLLVIGIVFAGWYFYKEAFSGNSGDSNPVDKTDDNEIIYDSDHDPNEDEATSDEDENDDEDESDEDKDEDDDSEKQEELKVVEKGSGASPESTLELKNAGDDIQLKLEVDKETYVSLKNADEESYYEQEMTPDDSPQEFDISDDDRIYLNIGNVPGVTVTINDEELEYPVDKDQFVHQKFWINLTSYDE